MKICASCGFENIDEAKFCKNCGEKLNPTSKDIDNTKIIVSNNNNFIKKIFYKKDKYTGNLRIAKTNTISLIVFIVFFLFEFSFIPNASFGILLIASIIFGLIFAIPTYIIGWVLGKVIDKSH